MALSARFKEMRSRLVDLRRNMLPASFSPTGDYTDRQLDRARGYRLLVHAEIESYLEDISRETVMAAIGLWKKNKEPSNLLVAFLAAYHSSWDVDDSVRQEEIVQIAKSRINVKDAVEEIVNLAHKQFINRVKSNNGIRDKNFKSLILPTGIEVSSLDQTWLTNLDNFGQSRGEVAHNTMRVTGVISPQTELQTVTGLLIGLKELDLKISNLS